MYVLVGIVCIRIHTCICILHTDICIGFPFIALIMAIVLQPDRSTVGEKRSPGSARTTVV